MKKIIFNFLILLILISFTACNYGEILSSESQSDIDISSTEISRSFINFKAQYIRTNGYHEEIKYPIVKIIRSKNELNEYYNKNKEKYTLDFGYDSDISFLDACKKYDEEYFENRILIMVLLEEGSGSIRHNIDSVEYSTDGKMNINILRIIPEIGTDDMALWHVLIDPEVDTEITSESDVFVKLNDAYEEKEESGLCWLPVAKPVIYLYPEKKMNVSVKLSLDGELTCTYPKYEDGWNVTAYPDGTLVDKNGQKYNYLYWEGKNNAQYDFSKGFCIKGEETAEFLEDALYKLGLSRREANEFIVYWLPLMEQNPYNIISFQTDVYTDAAKLDITPSPDTLIRVFMAWQKSDVFVEIPEQKFSAPKRNGFTVIEWGGSEIK